MARRLVAHQESPLGCTHGGALSHSLFFYPILWWVHKYLQWLLHFHIFDQLSSITSLESVVCLQKPSLPTSFLSIAQNNMEGRNNMEKQFKGIIAVHYIVIVPIYWNNVAPFDTLPFLSTLFCRGDCKIWWRVSLQPVSVHSAISSIKRVDADKGPYKA